MAIILKPMAVATPPPVLRGDARLRQFGYSIYLRPTGTQAIWTRGGRLYTVSEAEREIARRIKQLESPGDKC